MCYVVLFLRKVCDMTPGYIVEVAKSYLGQEEKSGNKGYKDPVFEEKMKAVGWQINHSWCCYFTELVAKEAFAKDSAQWKAFDKLFQPSCTATYENFAGSSMFKVGTVAKVGALAVWRHGAGWKGHIGVVESVDGNFMYTIEGNTNAAGSREGTAVLRKKRSRWVSKINSAGLNLIGFIYLC